MCCCSLSCFIYFLLSWAHLPCYWLPYTPYRTFSLIFPISSSLNNQSRLSRFIIYTACIIGSFHQPFESSSSSCTERLLMVKSYGLLNEIFPFPSILDAGYPIFKLNLANVLFDSYVYWTVHHLDSWVKRDKLDVTCFIISIFNAQHVSDVNTSILRSLRLMCWVISWVVLIWFDVCWCYVVVWL